MRPNTEIIAGVLHAEQAADSAMILAVSGTYSNQCHDLLDL